MYKVHSAQLGLMRVPNLYIRILKMYTEWMEWMSHRKRRETKQSMFPCPAVPGCCLVSFCCLCNIHSIHPVQGYAKVRGKGGVMSAQPLYFTYGHQNIIRNADSLPQGGLCLRRRRRRHSASHVIRKEGN